MSDVPRLFEPALAARRLARALDGEPARFLLERCAEDLADRLAPVKRRFGDVLDFFTPGPDALAHFRARDPSARLTHLVADQRLGGADARVESPEAVPLPAEAFDCVVSLLALHAVDDVPGALIRIRRALKPDGLFIAAIPGGETLHELRAALLEAESEVTGGASPRVFPFADVRAYGQLLQRAGLALPVADSETIRVRYASPLGLMRDLRAMGATNILADRSRKPLPRAVLARMLEIYGERFSDPDGRVRARFEIVWLSGWAPHESQQKPLRPGSAKARLADALAAVEIPSGEKPGP
jgi:SAM-dependent methyltransferase